MGRGLLLLAGLQYDGGHADLVPAALPRHRDRGGLPRPRELHDAGGVPLPSAMAHDDHGVRLRELPPHRELERARDPEVRVRPKGVLEEIPPDGRGMEGRAHAGEVDAVRLREGLRGPFERVPGRIEDRLERGGLRHHRIVHVVRVFRPGRDLRGVDLGHGLDYDAGGPIKTLARIHAVFARRTFAMSSSHRCPHRWHT